MDADERDPDLLAEDSAWRRARADRHRRLTAWDEPPDYYDDDPEPICSRCAAPLIDGNDGCGDPACPNEEV
jgi:hypothetical protein